MNHLLEMRSLAINLYRGKKLPQVRLCEGIDLDINVRQNFGIVGESGCGKSITCSAIMGLLSYPLSLDKGTSIRFASTDGEVELTRLSPQQLRRIRGKEISMIFQEPMTALDPMYTIESQINEALSFHTTSLSHREMHDLALTMLEKVKIPRPDQILADYPHHLSGGMLQRVMIAIALINNPRLLIADEPTTALDVTIQAQILDLMNELREGYNTSVIMITHDLGVIAETCERVAVFYAGQVVEQAEINELFHETAHPYTMGLLKSVTSLGKINEPLYSISGAVPTAGAFAGGCRFHDRCTHCMERCRTEMPALSEISPGHLCRCWMHDNAHEEVTGA
ncbi:MAG: ABC transporter ATP-binding protein [Clostridia bacterium]|nr:ABC transporter ATP-binding protein [Clostridia bacterium]